jgi:hypothetical protein
MPPDIVPPWLSARESLLTEFPYNTGTEFGFTTTLNIPPWIAVNKEWPFIWVLLYFT